MRGVRAIRAGLYWLSRNQRRYTAACSPSPDTRGSEGAGGPIGAATWSYLRSSYFQRRVCGWEGYSLRRIVVARIVVGRRVVSVPGPPISESEPDTDERCAVVTAVVVMVAVEVAMAMADMPAVLDLGAAGISAAALARKRRIADNYCERKKQCCRRRTHRFRLHPLGRNRATGSTVVCA